MSSTKKSWRRGSGSNRRIKVLQTSPLPLGYRALAGLPQPVGESLQTTPGQPGRRPPRRSGMERETRFELATLALARRCSTTELLPLVAGLSIPGARKAVKPQPGPKMKPVSQYLSVTMPKHRAKRLAAMPNLAAFLFLRAQSRRRACRGCGWQWPRLQGCG